MLTKGQHPFVGKFVAETLMNILEGKYDLQGLSCNYEAMCLVEKMIQVTLFFLSFFLSFFFSFFSLQKHKKKRKILIIDQQLKKL